MSGACESKLYAMPFDTFQAKVCALALHQTDVSDSGEGNQFKALNFVPSKLSFDEFVSKCVSLHLDAPRVFAAHVFGRKCCVDVSEEERNQWKSVFFCLSFGTKHHFGRIFPQVMLEA